MTTTKILIVEDNQILRMGLVSLFDKSNDIEVIASTDNGRTAVLYALKYTPDVILMDVNLPVLDGVDASKAIVAKNPLARILALSHENCADRVAQIVQGGALGYVLKEASFEELVLAIHTLEKGNSYFSKEVSLKLFARLGGQTQRKENLKRHKMLITVREQEILQYVADELSNREIADRLYISPRTVETHKRNLIQKLKVKNTVGLVKYYLMNVQHFRENTA